MSREQTRIALFLIFFMSGFTGLIYESLWSHYLKLFLGHAAYAQTLVLIIFMGGMAMGAAFAGRISGKVKNLLRGYALAEIGIGLLALIFHTLFAGITGFSFDTLMPSLGSALMVDIYKWSISLLLLLPPSILLGMTFPLMSGAVLRRFPMMSGSNLASLYFSNSLGAALGVLAATFIFIGAFGLPGTLSIAGIMNLLIGMAVLLIARTAEPPSEVNAAKGEADQQHLRMLFLVAAGVTGAASFIYEISWIRMLSLVLGSSFHAFELMLSAFITGLALGSLTIRRWIDKLADPLLTAAVIQIAMGIFAVMTLPVYAQSFEWMGSLVNSLSRDDQGYLLFNLASHGIAFAVMLPATFMAGMTLPLFTHAMLRQGHGEQSIGAIYSANTLGGIVGVILAMHFALPNIGLKLTLAGGALLDIGLGLVLLRLSGASPGKRVMALASLLIPLLAVQLVTLDTAMLGGGVYRTGIPLLGNANTIFYRDGKTASISVLEIGSTRSIRTNGKADASIEMDSRSGAAMDEITMVMAAAIPLAMNPEAQRIANIGFGSGLTAHTVLASQNVVELENIEIEQAMIDGARAFLPRVERAYHDPRSHINIEDAKSWFARNNKKFDVIISEPSNPWVSGVASLFSEEFYRQTRNYLTERGMLVQWLNVYDFNSRLASSVMLALDKYFGDYRIYQTDDANILIVAVKEGKLPPLSDKIFESGAMSRELGRVGIHSMDDLHLRQLGSAAMFSPMLKVLGAPINSDYAPYVELNAPRARFLKEKAMEFPMLGMYSLPLLEMLNPQSPKWEFERLTPTDSIRYSRIRFARNVHAALLGLPYKDDKISGQAGSWRTVLNDCAKGNPHMALTALHDIALATLAHLDHQDMEALWAKPKWLRCTSPQIRSRLAVYQAVARRDEVAMLAAAKTGLQAAEGDVEWERYLLEVGLLAARALSIDPEAESLWGQYGPALYAEGRLTPELVLLLRYRTSGGRS